MLRAAEVSDKLAAIAPIQGVYGNIDGQEIRLTYPKTLRFNCEGVNVFMTHIGGYPGKYSPDIREELKAIRVVLEKLAKNSERK